MSGRNSKALSLVGTVIAIVAGGVILAGGLFGLAHAREEARAKQCLSILSRYGTAFAAYAEEYGHVLPYENVGAEQHGRIVWTEALAVYMDEADRLCPSVDRSMENHREGYRMNSKLSRRNADPPQPYRLLSSLSSRPRTVLLFDAGYGGSKLSLKGRMNDVDFRHNGSVNVLFADWHVARFGRDDFVKASNWLPPEIIWDPDRSH